jgi:peptide/nickel transport system permease protein
VAAIAAGAPSASRVRRDWRGSRFSRIIARRLILAVPLLAGVTALSFVLISRTPGDAAETILGPNATPSAYDSLRRQLGLDQPLYEQYWHWAQAALAGNLGSSVISGQSVTSAIGARLPVTVSLITGAALVSLIAGVALGMFSATHPGWAGHVTDAVALVGFAVPGFWAALELSQLFSVRLRWLPSTGYVAFSASPVGWLQSMTLPVLTLSLVGMAAIAKQTREAMLEALSSEYVKMARANGTPARLILFRDALKNVAIRIVTVLGLLVVALLTGTVIVETIFALPGLGSLAVDAAGQHDIPEIQGLVVCFALIVLALNLLIDCAYAWLNPKTDLR